MIRKKLKKLSLVLLIAVAPTFYARKIQADSLKAWISGGIAAAAAIFTICNSELFDFNDSNDDLDDALSESLNVEQEDITSHNARELLKHTAKYDQKIKELNDKAEEEAKKRMQNCKECTPEDKEHYENLSRGYSERRIATKKEYKRVRKNNDHIVSMVLKSGHISPEEIRKILENPDSTSSDNE